MTQTFADANAGELSAWESATTLISQGVQDRMWLVLAEEHCHIRHLFLRELAEAGRMPSPSPSAPESILGAGALGFLLGSKLDNDQNERASVQPMRITTSRRANEREHCITLPQFRDSEAMIASKRLFGLLPFQQSCAVFLDLAQRKLSRSSNTNRLGATAKDEILRPFHSTLGGMSACDQG